MLASADIDGHRERQDELRKAEVRVVCLASRYNRPQVVKHAVPVSKQRVDMGNVRELSHVE